MACVLCGRDWAGPGGEGPGRAGAAMPLGMMWSKGSRADSLRVCVCVFFSCSYGDGDGLTCKAS